MTNVLVVKANNRPDGISTKMYDAYMETIKESDNMNVEVYDTFTEDMPYIGQELFSAFGKLQNEEALDEDEQRLMDAKQKARDAFEKEYVYAERSTFQSNADGAMAHLKVDEEVVLLDECGGVCSVPDVSDIDVSINYMKNVFVGIFGMAINNEIIIEGHNAMPEDAARI